MSYTYDNSYMYGHSMVLQGWMMRLVTEGELFCTLILLPPKHYQGLLTSPSMQQQQLTFRAVPPSISEVTVSLSLLPMESSIPIPWTTPTFSTETVHPSQPMKPSTATRNSTGFWESTCIGITSLYTSSHCTSRITSLY